MPLGLTQIQSLGLLRTAAQEALQGDRPDTERVAAFAARLKANEGVQVAHRAAGTIADFMETDRRFGFTAGLFRAMGDPAALPHPQAVVDTVDLVLTSLAILPDSGLPLDLQLAALRGSGAESLAGRIATLKEVFPPDEEPESLADLLAAGADQAGALYDEITRLTERGGVPRRVQLTPHEIDQIRAELGVVGIQGDQIDKVLRTILDLGKSSVELSYNAALPGIGHGRIHALNEVGGTVVVIYQAKGAHYPRHLHVGDERAIMLRGALRDQVRIYSATAEYLKVAATVHSPEAFGWPATLYVGVFLDGGPTIIPDTLTVEPELLMATYGINADLLRRYHAGVPPKDLVARRLLIRYLFLVLDRHHQFVTTNEWKPFMLLPADHVERLIRDDAASRVREARGMLRFHMGAQAINPAEEVWPERAPRAV